MSQSASILTTACPKPAVPLEDCQREYGKVTHSASPQRSRYTGPLSFPSSCTMQRSGFSIGGRSGYLSAFTNSACAPSLASNDKTKCRTKKPSRKLASPAHLPAGAAVLDWPRHKNGRACMPKTVFFSELQEGKRDRGAPRKRYKEQLTLAQAGINQSESCSVNQNYILQQRHECLKF